MGFPAGLPRTITADLSGKLPMARTRIRITTNLQIYWDSILIDRSAPRHKDFKLTSSARQGATWVSTDIRGRSKTSHRAT